MLKVTMLRVNVEDQLNKLVGQVLGSIYIPNLKPSYI